MQVKHQNASIVVGSICLALRLLHCFSMYIHSSVLGISLYLSRTDTSAVELLGKVLTMIYRRYVGRRGEGSSVNEYGTPTTCICTSAGNRRCIKQSQSYQVSVI